MRRALAIALLLCSANLWAQFGSGTAKQVVTTVTTLPATCHSNPMQIYGVTGASPGLYNCYPDNTWNLLGSGGGGAVSSVSNSDGTLTISPTTGAVVASLNLGHVNTWTANQTFPSGSIANSVLANSAITIAGTSVALGGSTASFPSPGAIGGTTPAAGTFTTLTANTSLVINGSTAITSASSTNSQVVTCPPGGTTTQVCDAAGAWISSGGAPALSAITAATGTATIASGNNPITWNWAQTTDAQDAFSFGETSAATGGTLTNNLANQAELQVGTASGSTATPLEVQQAGVTGTTGPPLLQLESTWNNASLVGQGIFENVTNTSSAAGSKLINLQVGNATQFSVDKAGSMVGLGNLSLGSGPPSCGTGVTGAFCLGEASTAITPAASMDACRADSTAHQFKCSLNNGAEYISLMNFSTVALGSTSAGGISGQLPIGNVGSAGLSGTAPITVASTGVIACATCVVNNNTNTGTSAFTLDSSASTTAPSLKLPAVTGGTLLAGTVTAALSTPAVFQNTNSTNNNTSIGLIVHTPGTSTGQKTLVVSGTTTQGNLIEADTGATVTNGVESGQTAQFQVGATGLTTLGAANCTAVGTAGGFCLTEGTNATNVAGAAAVDANSTTHELAVATNGDSNYGMLVRAQPVAINQTGKTAAITTATLCAAAAGECNVAGQYHVHWDFWGSGTACSSVTAGSVTFLLTWTDENAVSHAAAALQMMAQTGAATTAMQASFPFQTALANEGAGGDFTFSTNGSVIQYATGYTACTTGTGTYNLRATVTRLQ